ncbi:MAG TPA: lipopolysaccharide assembly protein LapA domain-containing protein [Solirubrobacteraceae bacterium]|jgi:uncharacterized integral membrane protein
MTSASGAAEQGPSRPRAGGRSRRDQARLALAAVLGGLTVAFALLNTGEVAVDWIFGTFNTPLIVVIVVSLLVGALFGFALARRGRPGRGAAKQSTGRRA